jgi:hypothetical protein
MAISDYCRANRAIVLACLGVIAAQVMPLPAAASAPEAGSLTVLPPESPGTIVMHWRGQIAAPMAQRVREAFEANKHQAGRFILKLDSHGGSVREGERVIDVLRSMKQTHQLDTLVGRGSTCGSMCVFIYVQGQKRFGALSSTWLFHEVAHNDPVTKMPTRLDRGAWETLVDKYFRPAGVSDAWIGQMKPHTVQSDYWQTGADLVAEKAGVITNALANQQARLLQAPGAQDRNDRETSSVAAKSTSDSRAGSSSPECKKYFSAIGSVISVPCS